MFYRNQCFLFVRVNYFLYFQIIEMECQVEKNEHFRHLLLFAFNQGSKAAKAARDICAVYGEGAIAERTARDWYANFKNGNFDLKDAPRSGRPVEFDEERLNQLLHKDSRQMTMELEETLGCSHTAIEKSIFTRWERLRSVEHGFRML